MGYIKFDLNQPQRLKLMAAAVYQADGQYGTQFKTQAMDRTGETADLFIKPYTWKRMKEQAASVGDIWTICKIEKDGKSMFDCAREAANTDGELLYLDSATQASGPPPPTLAVCATRFKDCLEAAIGIWAPYEAPDADVLYKTAFTLYADIKRAAPAAAPGGNEAAPQAPVEETPTVGRNPDFARDAPAQASFDAAHPPMPEAVPAPDDVDEGALPF